MSASSQDHQENVGHQGMFDTGLIEALNNLQDALKKAPEADLLPELVVVGEQSAGKSSLLEALVGHKPFLPRGGRMVTRCPLVLRLIRKEGVDRPFGEFEHAKAPKGRFTDFAEIRKTIISETDKIVGVGKEKEVKDFEIKLKITSSNVLNMTLVDLPGLVVNAIEGQPKETRKHIEDMVRERISKESSIIVLVREAYEEHANSHAFQFVEGVDEESFRKRTIGVLTKADLVPEKPASKLTDVVQLLSGGDSKSRLDLGYFAVKLSKEVENRSFNQSKADEANFFENKAAYSEVIAQCGIEKVNEKLNRELCSRFLQCCNQLKFDVEKKLKNSNAVLKNLAKPPKPEKVIDDFTRRLEHEITPFMNGRINRGQPRGRGCKVRELIGTFWKEKIDAIKNPLTDRSDEDVWGEIDYLGGCRAVTDTSWLYLAADCIGVLEEPAKQCVREVHGEMLKQANKIISTQANLQNFPNLKANFLKVYIEECIDNARDAAQEQINRIIHYEKTSVSPIRANFSALDSQTTVLSPPQPPSSEAFGNLAGAAAHAAAGAGAAPLVGAAVDLAFKSLTTSQSDGANAKCMQATSKLSDNFQYLVELTRQLVGDYFKAVQDNAKVTFPMIILCELAYDLPQKLNDFLKSKLDDMSVEQRHGLLREDSNTRELKGKLEMEIEGLKGAMKVFADLEMRY